jgi:hypothetical protein
MVDNSDEIKRIENRYNIKIFFKGEQVLRSSLMQTRPEKDPQQVHQVASGPPREYGRRCKGEASRFLAALLNKHRYDHKESLRGKR